MQPRKCAINQSLQLGSWVIYKGFTKSTDRSYQLSQLTGQLQSISLLLHRSKQFKKQQQQQKTFIMNISVLYVTLPFALANKRYCAAAVKDGRIVRATLVRWDTLETRLGIGQDN